jgi:RNA polymerase sigma-70 factor (ECF subfamily)
METEPADERLAELGRLYDRLSGSLFRYAAMMLADRSEAEDVVQRVFVRLLDKDIRDIEAVDGYARRAVRNECLNVLGRSRERAVDPAPFLEVAPSVGTQPEERLAVEQALRDLPADQREVLHLKVYEGWTFAEIAALSGESINTVASRYRYGLSKLRARLG